jgi:hypothetical protein
MAPLSDLEKAPLDRDGSPLADLRCDPAIEGKENASALDAAQPNFLTPVFTNRSQGSTSLRPTRSYVDGHGYFSEPEPEDDDTGAAPQDVDVQGSREKTFEVGWDGAGDPLNPKNMRFARKWMIVIVLAFGSLCVTCTSSLYTITYGKCTRA